MCMLLGSWLFPLVAMAFCSLYYVIQNFLNLRLGNKDPLLLDVIKYHAIYMLLLLYGALSKDQIQCASC